MYYTEVLRFRISYINILIFYLENIVVSTEQGQGFFNAIQVMKNDYENVYQNNIPPILFSVNSNSKALYWTVFYWRKFLQYNLTHLGQYFNSTIIFVEAK